MNIPIVGFLRGINVGGHHKVPMAELRQVLSAHGCKHVRTLLNSGNFVAETHFTELPVLERELEALLETTFGFPIPVLLRTQQQLVQLVERQPFASIEVHENIRLYITFLKQAPTKGLTLPHTSADGSHRILAVEDGYVVSVLDLSTTSTPKGMDEQQSLFGKQITTRNWNTIVKLAAM